MLPFLVPLAGMFAGKTTKILIIVGLVAAVLLGAFIFLRHYAALKESIAAYETSNKALSEQIFRQAENIAEIQEANSRLNETVRRQAVARERLERQLSELNIAFNAQKDAAATQKVINKRMTDRFRCLEIASGSSVVPADAANVICPQFVGVAP